MDEMMTVIEDWAPPNPSPRTFMANLLNEEFGSKPFSDLSAENGSDKSLFAFEKQQMSMNTKEECSEDGFNFSSNLSLESSLFDSQKSSSKGGLAQRMARSGFNAPTINTTCIKSAYMASSSSEVRSPYLTIPPGLSPTTLLDSPVFLSNTMVQPSPTTGKLSFLCNSRNLVSFSASNPAVPDNGKDEHPEDVASGGFAFKPLLNTSSSYFSSSENKGSSAVGHQQSLQSTDLSFQNHLILPAGVSELSERKESAVDSTICPRPTDSFIGNEHSPRLEDQPDGEEDTKGEFSSTAVAVLADDGYNWRKYGQKQVKGSEFPRSYYKCTHPNCLVKKKVERSHEGHITEIIYKGAHNHAKPLPNRRSGVPSSHPFNDAQMDGLEHPGSQPNFDGKPPLWTSNAMDATSSALIATEFGNPSTSLRTQEGSHFDSPEAIDISSTVSNEEEEEDRATHGSVSLGGDGEEDESESKRRKLDACPIEMNTTGSRAVREPRVVVQTTSEVDILDDGYRWRKYGQKVVKGNPNPRSYYKCTSPGCTVRKHVERASHDLKSVITTYEGKHNHDVPAARNSNHSGTGPSTVAAASTTHRRSEPTQDGLLRFEGPAPLTNFSFPVRDQQLGFGSGFSFGMGQGLANLGITGLGPMGQVKMPVLSPFHSYMGQQVSNSGTGFMMPKGEPKEEPVSETGLPVPNGMTAYHQLLSRLPLGPQL